MSDLKDKTVCVFDYGLFCSWANKLKEHFGRVLLYVPWKAASPRSTQYMIGRGMEGVEKIDNLWDHIKEVDLFFFPDIYDGDLQKYLRDEGYPVWGGGKGEELELFRWQTKQLLRKDLKLPVQHVERIIGITKLREYLKEREDLYVKISMLRGDFETFHHEHWPLTDPLLDYLEDRMGANKEDKEFIVEDAINDAVEGGYDGFTIDGQYPSLGIHGYEVKDVADIVTVRPYDELPDPVLEVNEKLAPVFSYYNYRGFFSSEVRITKDHKPYLIDPCCRAGSPPNEVYQELFSNWPELIWAGANGETATPQATAKYGVEVLINSDWADSHWQAVYFPKKIEQWVKLRYLCKKGETWYVSPQTVGLPEIGAVVAVDDTLLGAIKKVKEYCEQIEGYSIDLNLKHLLTAVETIKAGEERGIQFSDDELPSLAEVSNVLAN